MTRYMLMLGWAVAWYIGTLFSDMDTPTRIYGLGCLLSGMIVVNWNFGRRNPTGLPFFNPPEDKE